VNTPRLVLQSVISASLAGFLLAALAGCSGPDKELPLFDQVNRLKDENAQLQEQLQHSHAEVETLKKQLKVLAALPDEVKGENLYNLREVKIARLTNLYDKDNDGKKETLIVYVQPIDQDGDIIKAAGDIDIELLNLDNKDGQIRLASWHTKRDELRKLWFDTVIGANYRLVFDVGDKVKDDSDSLTVKVIFTDYLTGRLFKQQKEIKPRRD